MNKAMFDECVRQLGNPIEQHVSVDRLNYVAWWTPIFDRSAADCIYGSNKGSVDYLCMNRVEANMEYLVYMLSLNGYNIKSKLWKQLHTREEYLTYSTYERVRLNYLAISLFVNYSALVPRQVLAGQAIKYTDINILERLVFETLDMMHRLLDSLFLAGEIMCGE